MKTAAAPHSGPSRLSLRALGLAMVVVLATQVLPPASAVAARAVLSNCLTITRPARTTATIGFRPTATAVSESNNKVFLAGTACNGKGRLVMLDARSGKLLHQRNAPADPYLAGIDDVHHRLILVAYAQGPARISLFDTATGALVTHRTLAHSVFQLLVFPHAGRAVLSVGSDVDIIDTPNGHISTYVREDVLPGLGANHRFGFLYVYDGTELSVIDIRTLKVLDSAQVGDCGFEDMQVDTRAGTMFAASSGSITNGAEPTSGSLCRLNARTGELLQHTDLGPGGQVFLPLVDEAANVVLAVVYAHGSRLAGFNALDSRTGRVRAHLPQLWMGMGYDRYGDPVADPRNGWMYAAGGIRGHDLLISIRPHDWHVSAKRSPVPFPVFALAARARRLFVANQYVVKYALPN